jgi:2',3'-cyclic-nucleotide 2'-phosphodiesterase/3'-nucleotidase/5'-nucleotidase
VIAGYPDGTFVPAQTVKVGEFTKMISLAFGLSTDLPYAYTDVKTTDWYAKYAGAAEKYKMFPNFPAKMLQPGKELTRNEVAVAIYQVLVNM